MSRRSPVWRMSEQACRLSMSRRASALMLSVVQLPAPPKALARICLSTDSLSSAHLARASQQASERASGQPRPIGHAQQVRRSFRSLASLKSVALFPLRLPISLLCADRPTASLLTCFDLQQRAASCTRSDANLISSRSTCCFFLHLFYSFLFFCFAQEELTQICRPLRAQSLQSVLAR